MPLPQRLARFNRIVTNQLARGAARRLPPLALVLHTGRRSGRRYATPVMAFTGEGTVAIALTYGSGVDWLANARSAGGCRLVRHGSTLRLGPPRSLEGAAGLARMPAAVRPVLGLLGVREFVEFPILPTDG